MTAFFIALIKQIALAAIIARLARPRGPEGQEPATLEDFNLPTVSQSRHIPLTVGNSKTSGPNILDAGNLRVQKVKKKSGNFITGRIKSTIAERYFLDIVAGIGYGPGELYEIWLGDFKIWDYVADNGGVALTAFTRFFIDKPLLFGDKVNGGVRGWVRFYPGNPVQSSDSYAESRLSSRQPGYPFLAYCVFEDFWFGNTRTFRGLSFRYGHFPNPFAAVDHKIGQDANPAYVLYNLWKHPAYGADIRALPDQVSVQAVAARLLTEGFGMARTWQEGQGAALEQECLDLIDGMRYTDPRTRTIKLRVIREDDLVGELPVLTQDNLVGEPELTQPSITGVATDLSLKYTDREADKPVTVRLPNTANRANLGRRILEQLDFPACSRGDLAQKLLTREGKRQFQPLYSGTLTLDRTPWDWEPGKPFVFSDSRLGLTGLVLRVGAIDPGRITDAQPVVRMTVIEDKFSFGQFVFDVAPSPVPAPIGQLPIDVDDLVIMELPVFLIGDQPAHALAVLVVAPVSDGVHYALEVNSGSDWRELDDTADFVDAYSLLAAGPGATTLVVSGQLLADTVSATEVLQERYNLALLTSGELVGFLSATYDSVLDQTTLGGVERGLIDTSPAPVLADDSLYLLDNSFVIEEAFAVAQVLDLRLLPVTSRGQLDPASATPRNVVIAGRHDKPLPPANVQINAGYFPAVAASPTTVSWAYRTAAGHAAGIVSWFVGEGAIGSGDSYRIRFYGENDVLVRDVAGLIVSSYTYLEADEQAESGLASPAVPAPVPRINDRLRITLTTENGLLSSHTLFNHTIERRGWGMRWGAHWGN
ncbi:hypothetical protein FKG94_03070 [Exilibacterium tricleocarpae]|uniref:Tip attachment protein J domain-containing protein n=1 Tax=Exilibacterium tricleocarpae TaxID=2591008 RepID=A0A545U6U0_9GAMM|nr:hypothetical protein [Exilibacterium tricleocarpae]TQV85185.1 hypothetical protein FKG94_03070 [Exilibacterium tricleocarpae]